MIVHVFGTKDCAKCKMLLARTSAAVKADAELSELTRVEYHCCMGGDIAEASESLALACSSGQFNPSKLPMMMVSYDDGEWIQGESGTHLKGWQIPYRVGVQTDYSDEGKGVITSAMIREELGHAAAMDRLRRVYCQA